MKQIREVLSAILDDDFTRVLGFGFFMPSSEEVNHAQGSNFVGRVPD